MFFSPKNNCHPFNGAKSPGLNKGEKDMTKSQDLSNMKLHRKGSSKSSNDDNKLEKKDFDDSFEEKHSYGPNEEVFLYYSRTKSSDSYEGINYIDGTFWEKYTKKRILGEVNLINFIHLGF